MKPWSSIVGSFAICLISSSAWAGGVTLTSVGGSQFALRDGQALPPGAAVRIGTFLLPAETRDQALVAATDYVTLKSWFQPLAESGEASGTIAQPGESGGFLRSNGFPTAGDIFGTISNISPSFMPPGTQLYVWVFNHVDPEQSTQWGIFTSENWTVPESLGTRVLSTGAGVQALHGNTGDQQLLLRDIPVSYGNWTWKNYTSDAFPEIAGAAEDPDRDGIANLAEYAWLLRANAPDTTRAEIKEEGGVLSFTFKRPRNLPDVSVSAECSPDLKKWFPAASVLIGSDADFDTLRSTATSGERCFWRVRFSSITAP